jgi:hypothetical protein
MADDKEKKGRSSHIFLKLVVILVLAAGVVYLGANVVKIEALKSVDVIGMAIEKFAK